MHLQALAQYCPQILQTHLRHLPALQPKIQASLRGDAQQFHLRHKLPQGSRGLVLARDPARFANHVTPLNHESKPLAQQHRFPTNILDSAKKLYWWGSAIQ